MPMNTCLMYQWNHFTGHDDLYMQEEVEEPHDLASSEEGQSGAMTDALFRGQKPRESSSTKWASDLTLLPKIRYANALDPKFVFSITESVLTIWACTRTFKQWRELLFLVTMLFYISPLIGGLLKDSSVKILHQNLSEKRENGRCVWMPVLVWTVMTITWAHLLAMEQKESQNPARGFSLWFFEPVKTERGSPELHLNLVQPCTWMLELLVGSKQLQQPGGKSRDPKEVLELPKIYVHQLWRPERYFRILTCRRGRGRMKYWVQIRASEFFRMSNESY